MKRYAYYPGCSAKGTGKAYEESLMATFAALDIELAEVDDWNCCGATAYMSIDETEAFVLAGRNLALAESQAEDLVAPCAACYLVLNKAHKQITGNGPTAAIAQRAMASVGLSYRGGVRVRHPLDVLVSDLGVNAIAGKVETPLGGLKVATYYGCQVVRPYAEFDSQTDPVSMDQLIQATGATVVDYPYKTRCCGGRQTGTLPEIGLSLVCDLVAAAREVEADVIATACPLCQFNLDAYQGQIPVEQRGEPIPIVFFTQIIGLALGLKPRALGLQRCIVPATPALTGRTADVS